MIFQFWDDQCIVYHCDSGQTHLLDSTHGKLLECLSKGMDRQQSIHLLQQDPTFELPSVKPQEIEAWIDTCINEFSKLNLLP